MKKIMLLMASLAPVIGYCLFCSCPNSVGSITVTYYWWQENNSTCGNMADAIAANGAWVEIRSGDQVVYAGNAAILDVECSTQYYWG